MKKGKKYASFSLMAILSLPLFANDIFDENITKQEQIIRDLPNQKSLKDLFDSSKFPVDDYIYKAGKRAPNENQDINLSQALKDLESVQRQNQAITQKAQELLSEQPPSDEQSSQNLKAMQERIKAKQEILKQELQNDNQSRYEKRIKGLLRAQILANRTQKIQNLPQSNKSVKRYGVDGFSNQKSVDISTNEHRLYRTIRAGRMIPAILTTAISSDLSGVVTAQIEQDIYAAMGQAVLIPRGSKAIGIYTNDTKIGHERLEIIWREIITPQGINILLTDAITADNMGMNGAIGAINNKYWERYGIAYSISTITNALLLGIATKIKGNNAYAQEIYSNAKSDISSVVEDIIQQQSQIKPTIEIKSGSRIFLVPTNHMWFAKPKNGEVLMRYFKD